jgi:hypothetical protein
MPLFTKKEIREKYGVSTATFRVYEKRQKIICSGDWVDDSLDINFIQLQKWKKLKEKKEASEKLKVPKVKKEKAKPKAAIKTNPEVTKQISKAAVMLHGKHDNSKLKGYAEPVFPKPKIEKLPPNTFTPEQIQQHADNQKRQQIDDATKFVNYEQKLLSKQKTELEIAKIKGQLIPTTLVSEVILALGTGFQNSYKNESAQLLIEIGQKVKMNAKDQAFFKGKLIKIINEAHKNAISEAKSSLQSLIEQENNANKK